jgi:hypothetical protein
MTCEEKRKCHPERSATRCWGPKQKVGAQSKDLHFLRVHRKSASDNHQRRVPHNHHPLADARKRVKRLGFSCTLSPIPYTFHLSPL